MIDPRRYELATQALRLAWTPPITTTLANALKRNWPPRPATFEVTGRDAVLWTSPVSIEHSIVPAGFFTRKSHHGGDEDRREARRRGRARAARNGVPGVAV